MQNVPCPGRGGTPSKTPPPLGRFSSSQFSSQITFGDMEIYVIVPEALARFARSLIIKMNISETACSKLDVIVKLLPCYLEEIKF